MHYSRNSIQNLIVKHKEKLSYLFFGVLTTIVNYASFAIFRILWGDQWIHAINVLTFLVATLFAYVTNKIFVFENRNWGIKHLLQELLSFFASRISSFCIEAAGLYVCVNWLHVGQYQFVVMDGTMAAKIVLSFVAVIINYFLSKFFVFRSKKRG